MSTHFHNPYILEGLTPEDFIASSIIRFGEHGDYIQEKMMVDYFAVEGNLGIVRGLRAYLQNQKDRLQAQKQIKVLDVGPAIGAFTALLVMQELQNVDLLGKVKLNLVDVSERVIERTQNREFRFPENIINPQFKSKISSKLRTSKGIIGSADRIPLPDGSIDICTAGFLFHHVHDQMKSGVADEMQRLTRAGGFIGIAEEWFDNYEDYAAVHQHDEIPLAYESIISYRKLRRLFPDMEIFEAHNPIKRGGRPSDTYYYFCGIRKQKLGTGPRVTSR